MHLKHWRKNQRLFSWSILSKRITNWIANWIANCITYDIAIRLQHRPKLQTRRTLGDNLHWQQSAMRIFWLFRHAFALWLIFDFLDNNKNSRPHNKWVVQDVYSNACGYHCMFYAVHRCVGFDVGSIANMYMNDAVFKDATAGKFFSKM